MGSRHLVQVLAIVCLAAVIAACGGDATPDTTDAVSGSSTTVTTTATTATTSSTTTTTTMVTTTTEAVPLFETLTERQQQIVDDVCAGSLWFYPEPQVLYNSIQAGESGVAQLEQLISEMGVATSYTDFSAAAQPICEEIGWSPLERVTATTAPPESMAAMAVAIGDLVTVTGGVPGCPMDEILAGERWSTGNVPMYDGEGAEWTVALMVDTSVDPFVWSFSVSGDSHRALSVHGDITGLATPPMSSDIGPEIAEFTTVFNDSLASISGGWPDTEGTVTINCA